MTKKFAAVFPGQGSQSVGMLKDAAEKLPLIQKTFAEASEMLGYDLWKLCQEGPEETLNQTTHTQPAILVASVALWRSFASELESAFLLAGHSLGEYSALVCADALRFEDAVPLVRLRAQLMQAACAPGEGAMAAIIGLSDADLEKICADTSVDVANFNSDGQTVIAGNSAGIDAAIELAKNHQAKIAKKIPVSVPAHSRLMKPAAEKFSEALAKIEFKKSKIPVLHNVTADFCEDPNTLRQLLVEQLYSPVRWTAIQKKIANMEMTHIWEVGPGKVLCGLAKRTIPTVSCSAILNQLTS